VKLSIDPRLERAYTIPSGAYLDPAVLEKEKDRIFSRTWQLVAHSSALARHGDWPSARTASTTSSPW
jgi:phenylpropionate dioxygenase-like ring-hydroxylating dioxygenase large terminal subunit